jgi:hypothetical protein
LPFVALLVALYLSIPALCKRLRRMRRRSWARSRGPAARILVAYAGMRDRMHDLNVGDPTASALEFVEDIDPDDEHDELAWLYTRAIYGDLGRDLQDDDVRAAEEMAASLARRVADAQTVVNRAVAWLARSSLRDPFTREIPNAWPEPGARSARRRVGRARVRTWIGSRLRRSGAVGATPALVVLLLLTGMFTTGCSATSARADTPAALPGGALPTSALGCTLVREPSGEEKFALVGSRGLVERGLVFSVHCADSVVGSVQLDVIKRHYKTQDAHVQSQLEAGFRTGSFATEHFGVLRLRRSESFGLQTWLWFPSDENVLEVFVMRGDFTDADRYVKAVLASQLGWATPPPVPTASAVAPQPSTSGSGS